MFVSLNNNTTDVTSVAETDNPSKAPELIPVINGVRVFQFLDFCVVFCRSLFVLFVWPLHFLPFFDLQILITPFGIFKLFLMNTMSTNNDLQSTPKKTKYRATKTPLKTRGECRCSGRVGTSCFSSGTRRVTLLINDKGCKVMVVTILTKVWSCSIFNSYGIRK